MCTRGTVSLAAAGFKNSNSNSFYKDGRKIRVGDCALFKSPQNSLPFIGIVRCLITSKECNLKFGVNWLYRASEVELEKGTRLDAAPNEIFYSFHEDEVPSASLLHPCKVAFLPEGVELPSGISSFICRRVYDINQKCLWWLTDQNYIDKRQEEVNSLLSKTRREMHATAQPGGRSPKTMNDTAQSQQASQAKASSDGAHNVSYSSSHGKGKKRERSDQDSEPVKRVLKKDDGESFQQQAENILKTEIASITERGGLVDHESVEKLVLLMAPTKDDKKIDLIGRSMLAGVVAATDKFDCLSWFVQLKGLPVFDEWLQEIHKGKIGDGNSHRDGDKSVEDFLLVLLRALDKLPVNLRALQMCNIGKSVNHLRSHKNLEIQRKARSLVDTWKKRVEAEMNIDDGKPGSNIGVTWHGKRTSDPSQGEPKNTGSGDSGMKISNSQASTPRMVTKPAQGEMAPTKNVAVGESPEQMRTAVKDDKSSSSSHSQSSSSEHIRTAESSVKEDMRNSTGETLRRTSRLRKTVSGLPEPVSRGANRDGSNRSSLHKASVTEKLPRSGSVSEKMHDIHAADGNSHKLIVKIPNRGRSPAVSTNGGSTDEPCPLNNRVASPPCSENREKPGCASKEMVDASQINDASDVTTKSWHSSDLKEALTGSDEAEGTSAAKHDEFRSAKKLNDLPKVVSLATQELNHWGSHKPSFSSMNALVESCVKHSEENALVSAVDDVGMNLLASVATSEMCKCDTVGTSPEKTSVAEDSVIVNSGRCLTMDGSPQELSLGTNNVKQEDVTTYGGESGLLSSANKLAAVECNSVYPVKQNDGQLDMRDMPSNEVDPDSRDGNHKTETNEADSEVRTIKDELTEDDRREKTPSIAHSEAVGANNKMEILLDPEVPLDTKNVVVAGVDRIGERKTVTNNISRSGMDQKLNKSGSYDMAGGQASATTDYRKNDNEGKQQNKEIPGHSNDISVQNKASARPTTDAPHASSSEVVEKQGFDLNEGFTVDEVRYDEQRSLTTTSSLASVKVRSSHPFPVSLVSNGLPASVTVAAAAKGAFVPPEDLLRTRVEIGWKGSAATSAFRPAEPRKVSELHVNTNTPSDVPSKSSRPFLNIDLNVPDNSMQDDIVSHIGSGDLPRNEKITHVRAFGGFDLDLNQVDEANEVGQYSAVRNGESIARRNFDLNDGPTHEDVGAEASKFGQNLWSHMPSQPPVVSLRMNNADMGNFASWFPPGNVIPAVSIPAVLPDRGEAFSIATSGASQRIYYTPGSTPFAPEVYRGPVLSSSPALSYPSVPYQYPVFPFGASFPVPGATLSGNTAAATYMDSSSGGRHNLPAGQSQYLGHPSLISSSYPRPYLVSSVPEGRSNGGVVESSNYYRWGGGSHGLDLNSGPGSIEVDSRREASQFGLRQFSVASSQALSDDQARMFQAPGVVMKRKETEGGWGDTEKPKQPWH